MSHVRALLRLPIMGLATGALFTLWLLSRPLALVSASLAHRVHALIIRAWARSLTKVLNVKINVRGSGIQPPFFLVSNHLSYLDILIFFSVVEGFFVAKSEVASWPILGFLARSTGTIFIDRTKKVDLKRVTPLIEKVLAAGSSIFVFPEGTSTRGASVQPFKPSMFEAAVQSQAPVCAASVSYTTPADGPPAYLAVCWWGDMTFLNHCYTLIGLKSIAATLTFAPTPIFAEDRKVLAQRAHQQVESIFIPVDQPLDSKPV